MNLGSEESDDFGECEYSCLVYVKKVCVLVERLGWGYEYCKKKNNQILTLSKIAIF